MNNAIAILSLLHEAPAANSATRLFRAEPVLRWTLRRLARAKSIASVGIICWEDQLDHVAPEAGTAYVLAKGPRQPIPELDCITAARRWSDGWRGGLLATCDFDLGFHGGWFHELARNVGSDGVLLVDPAAALVDPALLDGLVSHADAHPDTELFFLPAAPGLGGALLRPGLLERLAKARVHGGRLLHYLPDQISREPLANESCVPAPTAAARSIHRFKLDSDRQIARLSAAMISLNGHLISSGAQELVQRARTCDAPDPLPREVVLELNSTRATRPIWWPGASVPISREPMPAASIKSLIRELAELDDTRLTIAGVGDPLLSETLFDAIDSAGNTDGICVHVETDLLNASPDVIARLARSRADVVSVHIPAVSARVYERIMGVAGYERVLESIAAFFSARSPARVPILVPTFMKCRENLAEMEAWYDQWLRAAGCAVIRGPSDCGGQLPDVAAADMSPAQRGPCARLSSRLTILCDGRVVSCEEDFLGTQCLGQLGTHSLKAIWQNRFAALRADHRNGNWSKHPLCARCREWNRP